MIDFRNSDFAIWSSAFRVHVRGHFPFCRSRNLTSSISFPCWIRKTLSPGSQSFLAKTGVVSLRKLIFSLFWYLSVFWSYLGEERVLDDRAAGFGIAVRCSIEQTMNERDVFSHSNFACRASYEFNPMCGNTHTEIVIRRGGQFVKCVRHFQIRKGSLSKREARVHYVNTW